MQKEKGQKKSKTHKRNPTNINTYNKPLILSPFCLASIFFASSTKACFWKCVNGNQTCVLNLSTVSLTRSYTSPFFTLKRAAKGYPYEFELAVSNCFPLFSPFAFVGAAYLSPLAVKPKTPKSAKCSSPSRKSSSLLSLPVNSDKEGQAFWLEGPYLCCWEEFYFLAWRILAIWCHKYFSTQLQPCYIIVL